MNITQLDYELPKRLIAQRPAWRRDRARLMVLDRASGTIELARVTDLPRYLDSGDCLILNNSRVVPALLRGRKTTGARVEVLLLREVEPRVWEAIVRPGRKFKPGSVMLFGKRGRVRAEVLAGLTGRLRRLRFDDAADVAELMERSGEIPLPPYIHRRSGRRDRRRYQTIYADEQGSVAAPTAGLHFTRRLLTRIEAHGVRVAHVTVHVGYGTFKPVVTDEIEEHTIDGERYRIIPATAEQIRSTRADGGRVIAVGTTAFRALETAADAGRTVRPTEGETDLYVLPGYTFRVVDVLLTNFHLPRTSLLALVMAFAGREVILEAYQRAVQERFRFYSYGDAMLIL